MKKLYMTCLALLTALALLAISALAEAGDWTQGVLSDEAVAAEFPYHAIVDLGGASALIVSTTPDGFITSEDKAVVYVDDAGVAKAVLEVGGGGGVKFFANADEGALTHYSRLSGEEHIEVYHLSSGALEPVVTADRYAPHHYPEQDSEDTLWFKDGEAVSEAEGQALFDLYAAGDAIAYAGDPALAFEGRWGSGRCTIDIARQDDGSFQVHIGWGSSASEQAEWDYVCAYDVDGQRLVNTIPGTMAVVTYGEGGEVTDRAVEYEDGDATFAIDGEGMLTWDDAKENAAEGMRFERGAAID